MPAVRIAEKRVWVGDESRPLLHGEVHYWRLSPSRWHDALRAARDLGLDVVSSYVCWQFHELEPGHFDFRGETHPQRNLVGFVELAESMGFWLVLRPGPYIYAEWPNSGIPDRVVRYHRLHPEFLAEAERYMAAAVEVIAPHLATRGGPVVLVQADNEPDPWADSYASQLGLETEPGSFQAFLRERYGDVKHLSGAWSAQLNSFEEARAVMTPLNPAQVPRYLDVVRFYHHYTAEIVRWAVSTYRRLGIDVPIYANAYSDFGVQHWPAMERFAEFVGPDVYPTAELRQDPLEHRRMLERVRFTRTHSPLPYIPEFEAGIWHGWHARVGILPPHHYRLVCLSALLAGVAGWGWYMLVNRDNWYMSPIDELGNARPEFAPEFTAIVRVFREMDPPALEKLTDTAVAVDMLQLAAKVGGPPGEAVLEALYTADVDYELFDLDTGRIQKPLLFYAAGELLTSSGQQRLLDYIEAGGTLVVFQDAAPLEALRLRPPDGVLATTAYPRRLRVELGDYTAACSSPALGWFTTVPGQPICAERLPDVPGSQQGSRLHVRLPVGERHIVGYREPRGSGSIVYLSLSPTPEVVLALHRWFGTAVASRADSPSVSTALFRRPGGPRFLVAVNTGEEPRETSVALSEPAASATDLFSGDTWPIHDRLVVRLERKSGTVVRLA